MLWTVDSRPWTIRTLSPWTIDNRPYKIDYTKNLAAMPWTIDCGPWTIRGSSNAHATVDCRPSTMDYFHAIYVRITDAISSITK